MLINSLPFGLYSVIVISLIPGSIILYFRYNKTHPGLPTNKTLLFMPLMFIILFLKRYVQEVRADELFIRIVDVLFIIISVIFFILLAVTQYQSYKYGYSDVERLKKLKPLYIVALVMVALCAILIILTKLDENNVLP